MTGTAMMGLVLVAIGLLSIFLRRRLAQWVRSYFSRFGDLGTSFGKLVRPTIYGLGGALFVILGVGMVAYSIVP
jgi:phosphotransferase system  glucose/maltose/N-acetylglucosamine-specific IIC component